MTEPSRDFRVLDKDLRRVSNLEAARFHAARPFLRLGAAAMFVAVLVLLTLGTLGGQPGLAVVAAGMALAGYLALSIGSNDAANALAPAYGAGAIGLGAGLALMGAAQIAGALLAGQAVASRLATGIVAPNAMLAGDTTARVMLAALLGAALWISTASWRNIPVSTTHSIVGAIAGAGLAAFGPEAIRWTALATIASLWIVAPFASGLLAALILAFLRRAVAAAPDRVAAGRRWLPGLIAAMAVLFTINVLLLVMKIALPIVLAAAVLAALLGGVWTARRLAVDIDRHGEAPALKKLLSGPLIVAAALMAFAHGANDVGNVAGPLSVIVRAQGAGLAGGTVPPLFLLAAGGGIALGAVLFGRGLVRMVGGGITRLNPARALCITLATAIIVLAASVVGLPVSTTHVAVGGVFGVGFFREWDDRRRARTRAPLPPEELGHRRLVRRSHVLSILTAWIVTMPITGAVAALVYAALAGMTGPTGG